jgi:hypothetical protein
MRFDSLLNSTEKVIREFYECSKAGHLKKAGFRQDIKVERLDLIIKGLMKIKKTLLAGAGLKDAVVQINQTI